MNGGVSLAKKFYAVREGRITGIFNEWKVCEAQVRGYPGARYKSFPTREEALSWLSDEKESPSEQSDGPVAYIDGSFDRYTGRYACGVVLLYEGREEHYSEAFSDPERAKIHNVAGELEGAVFAMNVAKEKGWPRVDIYYDYQGIESWATGEWKRNLKITQAYHEFCQNVMRDVDVRFHKVKGHSGVHYNELADRLARSALDKT